MFIWKTKLLVIYWKLKKMQKVLKLIELDIHVSFAKLTKSFKASIRVGFKL